ncbi:MAG: type II toxin-antitoxin system RelE/ParE family toxin [Planctomycetes bacterium]|nr:type II toxin-antitoxin system RelE/ParE family toxin [Planctomycetota bacterium]
MSKAPLRRSVRLTPIADDDVADIWMRIAFDSETRASNFISSLIERIETLRVFADRYPQAPESTVYSDVVRCMNVGQYRVLYIVYPTEVAIVRVRHSAREAPTQQND